MKIEEIENAVADIWGNVLIKDLPITNIKGNKIYVGGQGLPWFGDEVLEELENKSGEFEVIIDL